MRRILLPILLLFSFAAFSQRTFPNIDQFERSAQPNMMILTDAFGVQKYYPIDNIKDSLASDDVDWLPFTGALTNNGEIYHSGRAIVGANSQPGYLQYANFGVNGGVVISDITQPYLTFEYRPNNSLWYFGIPGNNDFVIEPLDDNGKFIIRSSLFTPVNAHFEAFAVDLVNEELRSQYYPNTRDDSGTDAPENFLYTDSVGYLRSASISSLTGAESSFAFQAEAGFLFNGGWDFSFGNSAYTNGGGMMMPFDYEVEAITMNSVSGNPRVAFTVNGNQEATITNGINTPTYSGSAGDVLNFRTIQARGGGGVDVLIIVKY